MPASDDTRDTAAPSRDVETPHDHEDGATVAAVAPTPSSQKLKSFASDAESAPIASVNAQLMFAFSCMPKMAGPAVNGRVSM